MIDKKNIKKINAYFENHAIRIEASDSKRKLADYKKKLKKNGGTVGVSGKLTDVSNIDVVQQLPNYFTKAVSNQKIKPALIRVLEDIFRLEGNRSQRLQNFGKSIFVMAVESKIYGKNSKKTQEVKGFDKKYYETGQLEKSIVTYIKNK